MKTVSAETMRDLDRRTIEGGTPGVALMERAGAGIHRELAAFLQGLPARHRQRILIVTGRGSNGGDGLVLARLLADAGETPVTVAGVSPFEGLTGDARTMADRVPPSVTLLTPCTSLADALDGPGTVIVDALLGTGIYGPLRPPYDTLIEQINASGCPVVSVDLPSGLNADTGAAEGAAVRADLTITLAQPKTGLITPAGLATCGRLRVVDIGILPAAVAAVDSTGEAITAADIAPLLRRRASDSHKGLFGHLVTIGGSRPYTGAPILAGTAALRVGAGLATVAVPASIHPLLPPRLQALMIRELADDGEGFLGPACVAELPELAELASAIVLGPGLGRGPGTEAVVAAVLSSDLPVVVDADALFWAAANPAVLRRRAATILTPHPGEMRGLAAALQIDGALPRNMLAEQVARKTGATVVYKGLGTVVASPGGGATVNTSGNAGLSTAGSGDVLAGMIGGFLAQGMSATAACRAAVFLHGLAAELAPAGARALAADDLLALIGPAFQQLTPFA